MFRRSFLAVLLAATVGATGTASTAAAEPPVRKARDWRYVYYPVQQLYYSTERQIWFWKIGNAWSYGVHLPPHFRQRMGTGLAVKLATERPYRQHAWVEQQYGKPWRADHASGNDADPESYEAADALDAGNG